MEKIKPLTKEQLIISIDRLTRFKHTTTKYLRVFKDIIMSNLIVPKYSKKQLGEMDNEQIKLLAQEIINYSLNKLGINVKNDFCINKKLQEYENRIFNLDKESNKLLNNKINYSAFLELIDNDTKQINLKWLRSLTNDELNQRDKYSLLYPIEKVVISEGITEEILLPKFAQLCNYDFKKNGIYIISAGGKNQVVKLFYQLTENLNLPVFVLLDNDAKQNYEEIKPKLRDIDKVHVLKSGEFEDILPVTLIKKALNIGLNNISTINDNEITESNTGMVKNLENIFKNRGLHEFKKSEFAQMVKECVNSSIDISDEIKTIIEEIKTL